MKLTGIPAKRTVGVAQKTIALPVLIALLLFIGCSREEGTSGQDQAGHAKEATTSGPTPVPPTDTASGSTTSGRVKAYRSTMIPNEISQTPRKDSMGMDMVPVYESEGSMLELSEHARAMASVETVAVRRRKLSREVRAVGKVQFNETGLANITSRVEGYIERLFVDYTGVEVKLGDHLVEIYSPDLVVAQQEMLIALGNSRSSPLVASSTIKLLRWGLTQEQVDELVRNRKIHERLTLFSPISGTVIEKMVVQKAMVKPGDMLYRLANLESVWVYLDIYEYELPWIQYGQTAELRSEAVPGRIFTGRVWFISPVLDEESRTVKVLLSISNDDQKLKPGMYANAVIRSELLANGQPAPTGLEGEWSCPMHPLVVLPQAGQCPACKMALVQIPGTPPSTEPDGDQHVLAVPVTAVLDSGVRKIVYVEKTKGQFAPVEIVTGPRTDDAYPVISGLNEGDQVVARGAFLLDSQFQIRGLPSLFYEEGQAGVGGHQHGGESPAPAPAPAGDANTQSHDQHKR
jgi:Cu(I)/Ag(I) efflux system membrane fusion protein